MPRAEFDRELHRVQDEILILGSMAERALADSVEVLKARDAKGAQRIIEADAVVNAKRFAIEADCLAIIATQQPMAGDLRTVAAVLEIATELERVADYGKGNARISLIMDPGPLLKPLVTIPRMAVKAADMLNRSLDAFVRRDVATARALPLEDDEMDRMYNVVYHELLQIMMGDPSTVDRATPLLWVAHNLERAADRVTNICERIVFTVTGEMNELDVREGPF